MGKSGGASRSVAERKSAAPRQLKPGQLTKNVFAGKSVLIHSPKQGFYVITSDGKQDGMGNQRVEIYTAERLGRTQEYGKHQPIQTGYLTPSEFEKGVRENSMRQVGTYDSFKLAVNAARRTSDGLAGRIGQLSIEQQQLHASIATVKSRIADIHAGKLYQHNAFDRARQLGREEAYLKSSQERLNKVDATIAKLSDAKTKAEAAFASSASSASKASTRQATSRANASTAKPAQSKPRRVTANDYLNERVNYGGQTMSRAAVIADLKAKGGTQAMIDRYLQGLDAGMRARGETAEPPILPTRRSTSRTPRAKKAS